ncbi:MAG: hypothetical protein ABIU84_15500 [Thermoanaerobaculia bacterium]
MPPHVFAVRRRELRFAAFSRPATGDSGLELAEFHSLPLAEGLFGSGPLGVPAGEIETFAATIRLLVARSARPVREASIVIPDAWARSMVLELGDLPEEPAARLEVLRFRVKRMVPYRVEDLRIEAVPIAALGDSATGVGTARNGAAVDHGGSAHCLVTLVNNAVCTLIEDGFAHCGIRVGQLSGATLSTLQALLHGEGEERLFGLALVDSDGFNLVLVRAGVPVIWRQKGFTEGLSDADRARLLTSELRLTRTQLAERFPGESLGMLYLAAPRAVEPFWLQVLAQGLECQPTRLRVEHLGLAAEGTGDAFAELAPLAGAASREIA